MINQLRGFPIEEFQTRFVAIQELMKKNFIDAILVTTESDFHYFSGLVSRFWLSPTRPMYLILPAWGSSPRALIPAICLPAMKKTWVQEIRVWDAPCLEDDGVSALREMLGSYACLGIPMGIESQLRMPLQHLQQVIRDGSTAALVDVSPLVSELRLVKSRGEIDKIRHICSIVSDSFNALGVMAFRTEREVARQLQIEILKRGGDNVPYVVAISGAQGYNSIIDGPTDKILCPGDILALDTGAVYDGYYCDFNRNFIVDVGLSPEVASANKILWWALEKGIAKAKPGNTFGDIWKAMTSHLIERGIPSSSYMVGRLGHSVGLQLTELPSIIENEPTILMAGMVLAIEPWLPLENGKILVHEENIVITLQGCSLLSQRAPPDFMRIKSVESLALPQTRIIRGCAGKLSRESEEFLLNFKERQVDCARFHYGIHETPLHDVPALATSLGLKKLLIKDEGKRLGLGSFKGLGVSLAIEMMRCNNKLPMECAEVTLCTMTDGNHGKAVAHYANKYGYKSVIFVPSNMVKDRVKSLEELGARVILSGTYDDAVSRAESHATANGWFLISDTSWENYIEVPKDIVAGYGTIFREIERQLCSPSVFITHVIIQAGVGGLASAAAAWINMGRATSCWAQDTQLLIVEPRDADCLFTNIVRLQSSGTTRLTPPLIASSGKTNSIMAGLNCGIPSLISWPIIRDTASYFITIDDKWPIIAMRQMHEQGIIAGESGAAGLAALLAMDGDTHKIFDKDSVILLINTENNTDEESYKNIVFNASG